MKDELNRYKRTRIVEAASELFFERGFTKTTLDGIAERLGVNKPFIYQFFPGKADILAAVIEDEFDRADRLLDEACQLGTGAAERLRTFIGAWVKENIEYRMVATIFWQEQHHFTPEAREHNKNLQKAFTRRLTELIENGVSSGEFEVDNARLAAFALIGLAQWIPRWYRPDGEFRIDEVTTYFAQQALRIAGYRAPDSPAPRTS